MLLVFLLVGSGFDLKDHKVPNWWILIGLLGGIWFERVHFFLPALLVIVLFFILFLCRMMGAGDIKVMALICGYLGIRSGIPAIGWGFVIGAAAALVKLLYQRSLIQRLMYFQAYFRRIICTKEITEYYHPGRDGYGATISFVCCLFLGTLISIVIKR